MLAYRQSPAKVPSSTGYSAIPCIPPMLLGANARTGNADHSDHPALVVEIGHDDLEALVLSSNQIPQFQWDNTYSIWIIYG